MERARHSALGTLLVGVGCLFAGLAVGHWLPDHRRVPVWTTAAPPAVRREAMAPTSFADVVAAASPGVVTLRARLLASQAETEVVTEGPEAKAPSTSAAAPLDGTTQPAVFTATPGCRTGSGFVVNAGGLVVTSRHVVVGAKGIEVLVPGRGVFVAHVVGEDPATDLVVVRLREVPVGLTVLPLGDSETLRAGDWIVAVGNPFGFSQTVTAGVVSYVGRHLHHSDLAVTTDFVQFSAPVNPGSSGCPVLDLQGRVIGVTTQAAVAAQGISFAVPSRTLKWSLDAMARSSDGRVRRGFLGIEFASRAETDESGARCPGAVIVRVAEGEPAHRAGLKAGDVVLRVDGQQVADAGALHDCILRGDPGSRIALQLLRQGRVQDPIEAVLGEVGGRHAAHPAN